MLKHLQDFLVVLDSGEVIFSDISNIKVEEQLFGALISALTMFYTETLEGVLHVIKGSKFIINIFSKNHIQFIGISPVCANNKKSQEELHLLASRFLEKHVKDIKDNKLINIHIFENFTCDPQK